MANTRQVPANETRSTGPNWDKWPASLPQVSYITNDGHALCVTCANGGNGSRAADEDLDAEADKQWFVIGAQVNAEPTPCAHCERMIVSTS